MYLQPAPASFYIHWPFCPYRCSFCPFVALAGHDQYMERYHHALLKEITQFITHCGKMTIETIYLGGGTPSTYPLPLLLDTSDTLRKVVEFAPNAEITLEVNPGTTSQAHIDAWAKMGINRISIGVQSLNESTLHKLNRHQTTNDVLKTLEFANSRFKTISVDFILGLPGVDTKQWKDSIKQITEWPINHCSIYFLTIHEQTPLYFSIQKKEIQLPADDEIVDLYHWTIEYLHSCGFYQYELSSFAKFGHESAHNKIYWQRKPFKGFGLGAWSFDGLARLQNEKNLMAYLQGVENDGDVVVFKEELSREQIWLEKIMLGLRQITGMSWQLLVQDLSEYEKQLLQKRIILLEEQDLIHADQNHVKLKPKAFALEHEVIRLMTLW